jgi:hypothetical protein
MSNVTITRLSHHDAPWLYALRVLQADSATFSEFIGDLKANIPSRDRKWDGESKRWLLKECETVIRLLSRYNLTAEYDSELPSHRQPGLSKAEAAKLLYLQPDAPDYVRDAVYKALSKRWHPDAGGDTASMQLINAAMDVLRA